MNGLIPLRKNLRFFFYVAISGLSAGGFFVAESMNLFVSEEKKVIFLEMLREWSYLGIITVFITIYILTWLISSKIISAVFSKDLETVLKKDSFTYLPSVLLILPLLFKSSLSLLRFSNFGIYLVEDLRWILFTGVLFCIFFLKLRILGEYMRSRPETKLSWPRNRDTSHISWH